MYMCVKVVSLVTFYIWVPGMTQCKHGVWICGYPSHGGMMSWAQKPSRSVTLDYCTPLKQVGLRNPKVMGQTVWEIQVFRRSLELSTRLEMCDSEPWSGLYIWKEISRVVADTLRVCSVHLALVTENCTLSSWQPPPPATPQLSRTLCFFSDVDFVGCYVLSRLRQFLYSSLERCLHFCALGFFQQLKWDLQFN